MYPVLFEIPGLGLKVHSYGLMMALGFLAALTWIRYQSPKVGLSAVKMSDLAFLMIVMAIVGSRIAYVFVQWRFYAEHPLDVFKVWEGGLVFLGGLIACILTAAWYLKKHGLPFWKVSDVFMPGVALGHSLGRIGCFLAGCCYGRPCNLNVWYCAVFPDKVGSLAPPGVKLYPTQLMESAAEFVIFLFLAWRSRKKAFDGQIVLLYLILYSLARIFIEIFRGDLERGYVIPPWVSTSQFLGILIILFAVVMLILRYRKGRSSP
jgi:phosphatidylglycerol---prolipoprotein diacylglyceryl transferase